MKKTLLILILLTNLFAFSNLRVAYVNSLTMPIDDDYAAIDDTLELSDFRNNTYYRRLNAWLETYEYISKVEETIKISDFEALNASITFLPIEDYTSERVAVLNEDDQINIEINVPSTGLYELGMDYYIKDEFYTIPSINILINGESQYNELKELELDVLWQVEPLAESERYNRFGNELLPSSKAVQTWTKYYFDDYNNYSDDAYQFLLTEGLNTITITALNLPLYIGDFYIKGHETNQDYASYLATYDAVTSETNAPMITIQGESYLYKNDLEIKSSYYKESAMTPYTYKNTILNQLDGDSTSRGGTKATYSFEVATSGFYEIAFKFLHNNNMGVAAAKNIFLDGEVPFTELEGFLFPSSKKYQNIVLGDDSNTYQFYLEAGTHTLSLETTISPYIDYIDQLNEIMDQISSISLQVQTITGGNIADALDWNVLKYIPDLEERLLEYANTLETIYQEIDALDLGADDEGEVSTLNVAAKQLRRIAKTPNRIGAKLPEFSEGSGSAYQLIGNGISYLLYQPISIDCFYLYQGDVELPNPTSTFFQKLWNGIRSFFYSFFDTRYNDRDIDDETLEVWVGQSSFYLDIIQSMIDQGFTKETGIKVKCSIMNNTQKIVLSNATNDNPDVVMSLDNWTPYAYALRGMLVDLSKLDGFEAVAENYYANNFTPVIFEDGVYAIPETQSVFLLYYRKDVLEYLDLDIPQTWDDVIDMLPILQSHQMNFYHPLGGDASYKGFGFTSPLIYQFGGEIFSENGVESTLRDQSTIEAVKFMTDLFTIYDLPLQVSSFFEHFRSGDMPIGISTIDLYLQLKYAAPELSGQWEATLVPGMADETTGDIERWSPTYGKSSILFENSDLQEEGWELIKWWNQTDTQIDFMQNIKTSLGERYLVLTANMNALEQSVWNESIKDTLVEQAKWARIPAVTPGSYIIERELSNIWNKVVIDNENALVAINESVPRILRELSRKADEFGYISINNPDGTPYVVPMDSNISNWIKEEYDETR